MQLCSACGTENRDKAQFCRGCAATLWSHTVADPVPEQRSRRRRRSRDPASPSEGFWTPAKGVLVLVLLGAALGIGWGRFQRSAPPPPVASPSSPAPSLNPVVPGSPGALPAAEPATAPVPAAAPAHVSEAEHLRLSLEKLAQEDRERTAELARRRTLLQQQQKAEAARRAAQSAQTGPTGQMGQGAPVSPPGTTPDTAASAPPAAAPAASAPAARSVEALCASRSNLFSRALCRMETCGQAAFASDPTCVTFRRMEEKNRRDQEG